MQRKTLATLLVRLRELRKQHELTQERFAELGGISYKYYQALEAGRKKEVRLSTVERLAAAYGLEVWELLSPRLRSKSLPPALKQNRPRTTGAHKRRRI